MTAAFAADPWAERLGAADWDTVHAELDADGCALIGSLLTGREAAGIAAMYTDDVRFRSTINMARYRFDPVNASVLASSSTTLRDARSVGVVTLRPCGGRSHRDDRIGGAT